MKLNLYKISNIIIPILFITIGIYLLISSLSDNMTFYITPSDVKEDQKIKKIRLGGYVKAGTVVKINAKTVDFIITDYKTDFAVKFSGFIPNLFKDNQGVIVYGKFINNIFYATELLAKHDENYYPKK